ncbi:hypothetical protein BDZ90DRAFT_230191 [Jaminaea rosea]|uniref:Alpha/beta-hydrolase n=1 Tax=Jaminaea rosea TaxID=1569628 RepID=A0A316UWY2_9BASI|nr:hypothetical protein BDZ90DRAFT_230191 [Jaminaea rosea]PWN29298.1 hypothetical protein BDZ90DRAFT_230191 [Jaminaea rosea]
MPSFLGIGKKKGQSSSSTASPAYQGSPHSQSNSQASNSHAATAAPAAPSSSSSSSSPSQTHFDIAGLPIIVYGLSELTLSTSSSTAPRPPDVCVSFHLHGRGGDAKNEDHICRGIYQRATSNVAASSTSQPARELLVVTFDARNHGHRTTNSLGQKGWGVGNKQHALDLYGMILGNAADVSFLIDLLPAYLFPHDDRRVSAWCVMGKSLGGHAVWHVLKDEPRVTVGVNMIGCPDYGRLLEYRTKQAFLSNGPPHVPRSLKALIQARDPAKSPFDRWGKENPYWGKRILSLSGADDKLVHASFSKPFLSRLMVAEPHGAGGVQEGLEVRFIEGVGHEVTPAMVEEAGRWIGQWGMRV